MLKVISGRKLEQEKQKSYDAGLNKGYELGFKMGKVDRTNRGFIIGSKINKELDCILRGVSSAAGCLMFSWTSVLARHF